ncbi:MAG: hypothetical protein EZS28_043066, partial [Streblomastix strix]
MLEPYISDKETQWNMEKDSGFVKIEQGNIEVILQNAWTRGTMPFGTKLSPIFFAETIESILRQIRIHSEIKILNQFADNPESLICVNNFLELVLSLLICAVQVKEFADNPESL